MQTVRKKGRKVIQYSVNEYAELLGQTPQNIRYKAKHNTFKTELTGVSAHRLAYEYCIEVDLEINEQYKKSKECRGR